MKLLMENWKKYLNEAEDAPTSGGAVDLYDFGDGTHTDEDWSRIEPLLRAFMEKKVATGGLDGGKLEPLIDFGVGFEHEVDVDPVYTSQTHPGQNWKQNIWQLKKWGSEFVVEGLKGGSLQCDDCGIISRWSGSTETEPAEGEDAPHMKAVKRFFDMSRAGADLSLDPVFALWKEVAGTPAAEPEAPPPFKASWDTDRFDPRVRQQQVGALRKKLDDDRAEHEKRKARRAKRGW